MLKKFKNILQNKELLWNMLAQLIQMIGAILMLKLMSIYLTKGDYGKFALINSLIALYMILPFNALIHGVARYVSEYQHNIKYKEFFTINIVVLTLIFVVLYMIIFVLLQYVNFSLAKYYHLVSLVVLSEIYKTLLKSIENANRKRKKIAISALFEFTVKIVLLVILAYFDIAYLQNILLLIIIGNFIAILLLMIGNYKNIQPHSLQVYHVFSPIVFFGAPLILAQLFGWARDMSGRWFLEIYVSSEDVAVFAIMSTLVTIVPSAINSFISSYLVPILYQNEQITKGYTKKVINKLIPILLIALVVTTFLMYLIQNLFVRIFADEKYVEYAWMLPYMYAAYSFYIVSMVASYELYSRKMTKKLIYPAFISAVVAVLSGFILISNFGLKGALFGYLMTYIVYAFSIFYIVFYRKRSKSDS